MLKKIDKSLILNKIKMYYGFTKDAEFARFLNIKSQTLSNWHARNTFDHEILHTKCVDINTDWLLTGEGEMLKADVEKRGPIFSPQSDLLTITEKSHRGCLLCAEKDILANSLRETIKAQKGNLDSKDIVIDTLNIVIDTLKEKLAQANALLEEHSLKSKKKV